MRRAVVLFAAVLATCTATSSWAQDLVPGLPPGQVAPFRNDLYQVFEPPPPDVAEPAATQKATEYCNKMHKEAVVVAKGTFGLGSGLYLIFGCVPSGQGAGAASAQDQRQVHNGPIPDEGPRVHTGPNPDKLPGLPEAVRAACRSPPPSSRQDVNAKRSAVDAACGAVRLNCPNANMGCLEESYMILPSSCRAALLQLECAAAGYGH